MGRYQFGHISLREKSEKKCSPRTSFLPLFFIRSGRLPILFWRHFQDCAKHKLPIAQFLSPVKMNQQNTVYSQRWGAGDCVLPSDGGSHRPVLVHRSTCRLLPALEEHCSLGISYAGAVDSMLFMGSRNRKGSPFAEASSRWVGSTSFISDWK